MLFLKKFAGIMENTTVYRYWQMPIVEAKLRPVFRHNDMGRVRRVLDVGCGPGTDSPHFTDVDYLGIDNNEGYIEYARKRFGNRFVVADARTYRPPDGEPFDFILLNSLLHHIDDTNSHNILSALCEVLSDDGFIHILDLVLPEEPGLARWWALNDRGDFPRPLEEWRRIFTVAFESVIFEPYQVRAIGIPCGKMVYFKGRKRSGDQATGPA